MLNPSKSASLALLMALLMALFSGCAFYAGDKSSNHDSFDRDTARAFPSSASADRSIVSDLKITDNLDLRQFYGKPTVMFFWSSWCKVCLDELSELQRFSELVKKYDVNVVAVALMDNKASASAAAKSNGFSASIIVDEASVIGKKLGINALPATVFLDARGKVAPMFDPQDGEYKTRIDGPRKWCDEKIFKFIQGFKSKGEERVALRQ